MLLLTTHGRVAFSHVRHYLWMCVMGELLLFPRLQIPTHVQYRARLESIPELPLCLESSTLLWNLPLILSSTFLLVPCAFTSTPPDSDWNCLILLFYSVFFQWYARDGILGTRTIVSLSVNSKASQENEEGMGTAFPWLHHGPLKPLLGQN